MNLCALALFPLGVLAIAYAITCHELKKPLPPHIQPAWAKDANGKPIPANFNPPPPR